MHTDNATTHACAGIRSSRRVKLLSLKEQYRTALHATGTSDWLKRSAINRCIKPIQLAPNAAALKSWQPTTILSLGWLPFCHHWPKCTAEPSSYFRPSTPSLMVITRPPPPTLEFSNLIPQQKTTHLAHCSRSTCI